MNTFQYEGHTFDEDALLPDGERVNPEFIADGLMIEASIEFKGQIRHMELFTEAGMAQVRAEYAAEEQAYIGGIADFASNNRDYPRHMGACVFSGPEDAADLCVYVQDHVSWWGVDLGPDGNGGVHTGNVVLGSLHENEPRTLVFLPPLTTVQSKSPGGVSILELEQADAVGLALALADTLDIDHQEALMRELKQLPAASQDDIIITAPPAVEPDRPAPLTGLPNTVLIMDEHGMPSGAMDVAQVHEDGLNLAFTLAEHCGDDAKTEQILQEQITRHSTHGLGLVLIAAIKHLTSDILAGAFDFMEATPGLKPREKMAEIRDTEVPAAGTRA